MNSVLRGAASPDIAVLLKVGAGVDPTNLGQKPIYQHIQNRYRASGGFGLALRIVAPILRVIIVQSPL